MKQPEALDEILDLLDRDEGIYFTRFCIQQQLFRGRSDIKMALEKLVGLGKLRTIKVKTSPGCGRAELGYRRTDGDDFEPKAMEMQPEKMTEEQIIQAWKDNRFMVFGGMGKECQEWAEKHCEERIWRIPVAKLPHSMFCNPYTLYTLTPDYQPPAPKPRDSDWVEFDIVKQAYELTLKGCSSGYHWQCFTISPKRSARTLPDGRVLTKFGGWYWPDWNCWAETIQPGTSKIPTKIRFWAERIPE